jgi:cellulose synthase/poly-beta-1,6-N-acetylglucosamine synthase-like glycosyltransferase
MCFKIITQKKKEDDTVIAYNLIYYPGAWAKTDPPDSFGYLIAQRRRWINGSNFVFFYIIKNICEILNSNHSCF